MGGVIIGLCGGTLCYFATQLIKTCWIIDDSLDVFPVHGVGGALGTLLAAICVSTMRCIGYVGGMNLGSQLSVQALGVLVKGVYAAVVWTYYSTSLGL